MFKLVKCLEVIHILKLFVTLLAVVVAQLTEQSLSTQEDRGLNPVNTSLFLAVVVEQLTGRSLTIPEDQGLNPVIGNVIKQ